MSPPREPRELAEAVSLVDLERDPGLAAISPCPAAHLSAAAARGHEPEEYVSVAVLTTRIPYAAQTIRNLMSKGVFRLGVHYVKPRGRVMFKWSAIRTWLDGGT